MDTAIVLAARRGKLEHECARHRIGPILTPGLTVVPPGDLKPAARERPGYPGPMVKLS